MKRFVHDAIPTTRYLFGLALVFCTVFGQGKQDHGQLFFAYLAVPVKVTPSQYGFLEV